MCERWRKWNLFQQPPPGIQPQNCRLANLGEGLDANDRRRRLHASGRDFNRILELSRHYYKEMIALITLEYIPKITTFKFGSTQFSKEDTV